MLQLLASPLPVRVIPSSADFLQMPVLDVFRASDNELVGRITMEMDLRNRLHLYLRHHEVTADVSVPKNKMRGPADWMALVGAVLGQFNMVMQ